MGIIKTIKIISIIKIDLKFINNPINPLKEIIKEIKIAIGLISAVIFALKLKILLLIMKFI